MAKRNDPVTTFQFAFKVTEGDLTLDYKDGTAFFKSVSGLKVQQDIQDVNEGGVSTFTRKLQGVFKWPNLILKQGFTGDKKLFDFKKDRHQRINGFIFQLGPKLEPVCKWEFYSGYIVKWEGPDYDAQKNEVAIETIEIAHEGLVMNPEPPKKEDPPPPKPAPKPDAPANATVNFATNSSTVAANPDLDKMADASKNDAEKKYKVEGHTDNVGDAGYNKTLSQKRADAVKKYMTDRGAKPENITSTGYGEDKPIADNNTASGRAQNRRTTVDEVK